MEKTVIKKQDAEGLFKETFDDVITQLGVSKIFYCGRKMYVRLNKVIISVEFVGTSTAFSSIVLTASTLNGIIDQNVTPLSMIFKESKISSGQDKIVNLRMVINMTGEYTIVWSCDLTADDKMRLNNFLMNYIELFSGL